MAATDQLIEGLTRNLQPVKPLRKPGLRAALWSGFATLVIAIIAAVGGSRADLAHALPEVTFFVPLIGSWLTGVTAAVAAFQVSLPDRSRHWLWLPAVPILLWGTGFAVSCFSNPGDILASLALLPESACLLTIVLTSAALLVVLLPMLRRVKTLRPRLTAWLGCLAVAGFADTAHLLVHTEQDSLLALTVNLAPALALVVLGGLAGRKAI
ncbi:NrsF family protein [Dongia sedimenti]|uniref:NrsF family protein n=1 Tax=Dongia sedimenti TaxID=3064282 RepID=A0ABU0YUQ4_9PROT|nr:NrsF family protein [Rhodospirillaceae bacterium R-7]